jgi:hypothetical protein
MTATAPVQASAPPVLQGYRGLVFFRMRSISMPARKIRRKDEQTGAVIERTIEAHTVPGQVLSRIRDGKEPPAVKAEAWKPAGGKWSYDFGGRWLESGSGKLFWEWT